MRRVYLVQSEGGPACLYGRKADAEQHAEAGTLTNVWSNDYWGGGEGWSVLLARGVETTEHCFVHDRSSPPWTLLRGGKWYGALPVPPWLLEAGVLVLVDAGV